MSWRNITLIFHREVRDQMRDRRTLFMIAILPILLYPAMGIGMVQMTLLFSEQARTVVILGADDLPDSPPLLVGDHFNTNWFQIPTDANKLKIISDSEKTETAETKTTEKTPTLDHDSLLVEARAIRAKLQKRDDLEKELKTLKAAKEIDVARIDYILHQEELIQKELRNLFAASKIQVLLLVPDGFAENVKKANALFDSKAAEQEIGDYPGVRPVRNRADEKSQIAYVRVREAIDMWEKEILRRRLKEAGLHEKFATPVNAEPVDLAQEDEMSANVWSKLFPALLIIMAVTGAFYPAIDLGAGEKERGTMETLLICPATRTEIVFGKFLTVMLFSVSTALLNLVSMGFTGKYMASMGGSGAMARMGDLALPGFGSLIWVFILLIPLAALFSALCLSLATFARSTKEGQYYLTPLLMVTLGLTVFCLSPGVEIQPFYSVMPIIGPALLLKEVLSSQGAQSAYVYAIPVLITSIGYSFLAMWWAIEQFSREDILFREAERVQLKLRIQHLLQDKEPVPTFAEAGFCFMLIMFMQFGAMKFMQQRLAGVAEADLPRISMMLMMIQQLAIIASPALFMAVMLTTNFRRTLRLKIPSWKMLAVAGLLPLVLHPLSVGLQENLKWFFPPLPDSIQATMAGMSDEGMPLWFLLAAFAVAPAICEELAFRGFILSGFHSTRRTALAIGLSSLAFGIMHMIPQQVFNATLLGLVLGLIAIKSGSLFPCILFHYVNNSLAVFHQRFAEEIPRTGPATWFIKFDANEMSYTWVTLVCAAAASIVLLRWVANRPSQEPALPPNEADLMDPVLSTSTAVVVGPR